LSIRRPAISSNHWEFEFFVEIDALGDLILVNRYLCRVLVIDQRPIRGCLIDVRQRIKFAEQENRVFVETALRDDISANCVDVYCPLGCNVRVNGSCRAARRRRR